MPRDTLIKPVKLPIVYLRKGFDPVFQYLTTVRLGKPVAEHVIQQYRSMEKMLAIQLAGVVMHEIPNRFAIVTPRSSREDTKPYLHAILKQDPTLRDLSEQVTRKGNTRAATAKSLSSVINEFKYEPDGNEPSIKFLIILDETVGTARTVAAVLYHLCKAGLPADCEVTVVTPHWV
jgi:hypothetical protein